MYVIDTGRILSSQSSGSSHGIATMSSDNFLVGLEATGEFGRKEPSANEWLYVGVDLGDHELTHHHWNHSPR